MSLNDTPWGSRFHIVFCGRCNTGKSSLINRITNQTLAVVSGTPGTTTDPVHKSMELLPLGPVTVTDTAGFDDESELGKLRIEKTNEALRGADLAVLVADAKIGLTKAEKAFIGNHLQNKIPYLIVYNKCDLIAQLPKAAANEIYLSAKNDYLIEALKERLAAFKPLGAQNRIVGDLITPGALVVLVVPLDEAAPKGRLILPQQQTIRDVLDAGGAALTVKDTELAPLLAVLKPQPALVITDSQVFKQADAVTPLAIPLTSFSILMARYKGFLPAAVKGVAQLQRLKDGDRILISEGCTHHRQCGDIGTVKLPAMLKNFTGKELALSFSSGGEFPGNLKEYSLVIHCGGCMLSEKEMLFRRLAADAQNVPFTNYGTAIALMTGVLKRSLSLFPDLIKLLQ